MKSLSDSIDSLYAAFRDVPKPHKIGGCPCCIDDKNICTLLSKPLRAITGGELASYSSSAFLTVGEVADYMYFLPRILEVGCTEDGWWPDIEITGRAIAETQPTAWPESRRRALQDVFQAALQEAIDDEEGWTIDELICAIAKTGIPIEPFLTQIEHSPKAALAYYEHNSEGLMKQKLGNAFWNRGDSGYAQILAWFQSPGISKIVMDGYGLHRTNSDQGGAGQPATRSESQ
ncbi:hypothetical protein [Haloferula sargassicola]